MLPKHIKNEELERFWWGCITLRITGFLDFVQRLDFHSMFMYIVCFVYVRSTNRNIVFSLTFYDCNEIWHMCCHTSEINVHKLSHVYCRPPFPFFKMTGISKFVVTKMLLIGECVLNMHYNIQGCNFHGIETPQCFLVYGYGLHIVEFGFVCNFRKL
jgi:hypothetical protein